MVNRRDFLRGVGAGSLALASTRLQGQGVLNGTPPNILIIMVDQARRPLWYPPGFDSLLPARGRLIRQGVSFDKFSVNAVPCSPNRASLLTGLHAHQHWVLNNSKTALSLDTGFPTVAGILRDAGYQTYYFGKWHLTNNDDWANSGLAPENVLQPYGFDSWRPQEGGMPTDYEGGVNEGFAVDDMLTDTVVDWLASPEADAGPWFTVASLINPHDITWYPLHTEELIAAIKSGGAWTDYGVTLPINYESSAELLAGKPSLQSAYALAWDQIAGEITEMEGPGSWAEMLNFYLWLETRVDAHIGRILDGLETRPSVLENTVVIFTSDHGELAGSHGLKNKGCTMYEEQNRIPFIVADHTTRFVPPAFARTRRSQIASTVDVAPTILELAGVPLSEHMYLPGISLLPVLRDDTMPGAPFSLASSDISPDGSDTPYHLIHARLSRWKISLYNHWFEGTDTPDPDGEEAELYDLSSNGGRLELDNIAASAPQKNTLRAYLMNAYHPNIMAAPLPGPIGEAQTRAKDAYLASSVSATSTLTRST